MHAVEMLKFGDHSLDVFCFVALFRAHFGFQFAFVFCKISANEDAFDSIFETRLKHKIEKVWTLSFSKVFIWTDSTSLSVVESDSQTARVCC